MSWDKILETPYPTEPYSLDGGDTLDESWTKIQQSYALWKSAGCPEHKYSSPKNEQLVEESFVRLKSKLRN